MRTLLAAVAALVAAPAVAADCRPGVPCAEFAAQSVFLVAERYQAEGRFIDAETLLGSLTADPDPVMRTEARFRLAQLKERRGDIDGAVGTLRRLLVDMPEAQRPRLELARLLAQRGDEGDARRQLRIAGATGLPDDVARAVDSFAAALRSTRPFGGSFELALAPDSNINRATVRDTVDTVIAPLTLDEDAKARSGVGAAISTQGFWRARLGESTDLLTRVSARGDLYGRGRFNDIGLNLSVGPELRIGSSRLRPAALASRRWYGGDHYSDGIGGTLSFTRPLDRASALEADATMVAFRHPALSAQDGTLYDAGVAYDRALSARTGGRFGARVTRQGAAEPGFASTIVSGEATLSQLVGGQVGFVQLGMSRLEADGRLALFPERRRDTRLEIGGGVILRGISAGGLSPLVRVVRTINRSTVDLYDYARTRVEFGVARSF